MLIMKLIIMITAVLTLTGCGMDTEGLSVREYVEDPQELDAAANECRNYEHETRRPSNRLPKCKKVRKARDLTFYASSLFGQCITANTEVLLHDEDRTIDQDCIDRIDREHDDTEGLSLIEYIKNPKELDRTRTVCGSANWKGIASSPRCKKVRKALKFTHHRSRTFGECVISEVNPFHFFLDDENRTVDSDCVDRVAREQGLN